MHGGELVHGCDGVEHQHAAAAQDADVVVERVDRFRAEAEVFRPVELVRRGVVARRLGPADERDLGIPLAAPLLVRLRDPALHLPEQVVVVDRRGVVVLHEAVFVIGDHHRAVGCL